MEKSAMDSSHHGKQLKKKEKETKKLKRKKMKKTIEKDLKEKR